jgi:hypothetical protein
MAQTRKDQRSAPWERYSTFEIKLQDLEGKLCIWEERIVEVEDRLIRLDEYCEELFALEGTPLIFQTLTNKPIGSEKEKYDLAIAVSILLIFLFAYDGVILGLPHLNFWTYLVGPHVLLAVIVAAIIWKRGLFHEFPAAYVIGFAAFLSLTMVHQQSFLRNQADWRGSPHDFKLNCRN